MGKAQRSDVDRNCFLRANTIRSVQLLQHKNIDVFMPIYSTYKLLPCTMVHGTWYMGIMWEELNHYHFLS